MSLTYADVVLRTLDGSGTPLHGVFAVDPSYVECVVSSDALLKCGIVPVGERQFARPDGTTEVLPFGFVKVQALDGKSVSTVVFSDQTDDATLGSAALQLLGYFTDCLTGALTKRAAIPLKSSTLATVPPR